MRPAALIAAAILVAAQSALALSFDAPARLPGAGHGAALASADFDRDGRADIAVAFPDTDSTWLFPPRAQGEAVRVDPPPRDVRR